MNIALILGCFGALLIVPVSTPLSLYLLLCAGIVVLCNVVVVSAKIGKAGGSNLPASPPRRLPFAFWALVVFLILLMFLLNHGYWTW